MAIVTYNKAQGKHLLSSQPPQISLGEENAILLLPKDPNTGSAPQSVKGLGPVPLSTSRERKGGGITQPQSR